MKIRIVSDGIVASARTRVEHLETGELLDGVEAVTWEADVYGSGVARAHLRLSVLPVDVVGEAVELDDGAWLYVRCIGCDRQVPAIAFEGAPLPVHLCDRLAEAGRRHERMRRLARIQKRRRLAGGHLDQVIEVLAEQVARR